MAARKISLSDADREAVNHVLEMCIENSCSCGDADQINDRGYLGHDTDCHVHMMRKQLKRVEGILERARGSK